MFIGLALAIAYLKVGFKTRKSSIALYPNKLVYNVLDKLRSQGLILGYGLLDKKEPVFLPGKKLNNVDPIKRRKYLISVFFKYNLNSESVLHDIRLVSTSGHRIYFKYADIRKAYARGEIFLLSVSGYGLLFSFEIILLDLKVGGEVLLRLYF